MIGISFCISCEDLRSNRNRRGVHTFPGLLIAPPITTTSLTRRKTSGSAAAASAKLVCGPTATKVTVSGSFSRKVWSISRYAGRVDGINLRRPPSCTTPIC